MPQLLSGTVFLKNNIVCHYLQTHLFYTRSDGKLCAKVTNQD